MPSDIRILLLADSHLGFDLPARARVTRRRRAGPSGRRALDGTERRPKMKPMQSGSDATEADPRAPDPSGSRAVAELLRDQGVRVDLVLTTARVRETAGPGSTLLVTDPELLADAQAAVVRRTGFGFGVPAARGAPGAGRPARRPAEPPRPGPRRRPDRPAGRRAAATPGRGAGRSSLMLPRSPRSARGRRAIEPGLRRRARAEVVRDAVAELETTVKACGLRLPSRETMGLELPPGLGLT